MVVVVIVAKNVSRFVFVILVLIVDVIMIGSGLAVVIDILLSLLEYDRSLILNLSA